MRYLTHILLAGAWILCGVLLVADVYPAKGWIAVFWGILIFGGLPIPLLIFGREEKVEGAPEGNTNASKPQNKVDKMTTPKPPGKYYSKPTDKLTCLTCKVRLATGTGLMLGLPPYHGRG